MRTCDPTCLKWRPDGRRRTLASKGLIHALDEYRKRGITESDGRHHPFDEFLYQLVKMLTECNARGIKWSDGKIIKVDGRRLQRKVLDRYFGVHTVAAFEQLLSDYGFRKAEESFVHEATTSDIRSLLLLDRISDAKKTYKEAVQVNRQEPWASETTEMPVLPAEVPDVLDPNSDFVAKASPHGIGFLDEYRSGGITDDDGQHHPFDEFLVQLAKMLTDDNRDVIEWSEGNIKIHDQRRLEAEVLSRYLSYSKFARFAKELNLFGFRKRGGTFAHDATTSSISSLLLLHRREKSNGVQTEVMQLLQQQSWTRENVVTLGASRKRRPCATASRNSSAPVPTVSTRSVARGRPASQKKRRVGSVTRSQQAASTPISPKAAVPKRKAVPRKKAATSTKQSDIPKKKAVVSKKKKTVPRQTAKTTKPTVGTKLRESRVVTPSRGLSWPTQLSPSRFFPKWKR